MLCTHIHDITSLLWCFSVVQREHAGGVLQYFDVNVLVIDWQRGALAPILYPSAASNARVVGACSAYLAELFYDGDVSTTHCVGIQRCICTPDYFIVALVECCCNTLLAIGPKCDSNL